MNKVPELPPLRSEIEMMLDVENWPNYPVLPLKRKPRPDASIWATQLGVLVVVKDDLKQSTAQEFVFVPGASMFERITVNDPRGIRITADQVQSVVVDNGWVGD